MGRIRIDDCARAIRRPVNLLAVIVSAMILGCQPAHPLAGVDLNPPATWKPIDAKSRMAPGKPLAAWSGPRGSSLVVYSTLPIPGGMAESISASIANRLTNLSELEIKLQKVVTIDGRPVARVETVAPGTGDSLAPSSVGKPMNPTSKPLVPTREIILGLAEPDRTLFFCWNMPESARDQILPEIEDIISRMRLPAAGTTSSRTSY